MDEKFRKAYRESIRRVLTMVIYEPRYEGGHHVSWGLLRVMDDVFKYVDISHPRDRWYLDPNRAGRLLWFIAEQPLRQTNQAKHFVWVKALYKTYLLWVGPKKFGPIAKNEFINTLKEMFGWRIDKRDGRLAFIGIRIEN